MTPDRALWFMTAMQAALGGLWLVYLWIARRERQRLLDAYDVMVADAQRRCQALLDDLRRKLDQCAARYEEYRADPLNPKWQRGLFYDDPDTSSSVH
jgi:hypothetical protein